MGAAAALTAAVALTFSACAANESRSPRRPGVGSGEPDRHADRNRRVLDGDRPGDLGRRVPDRQPRRHRQLLPGRLGCRPRGLRRRRCRLRRLRPGHEARGADRRTRWQVPLRRRRQGPQPAGLHLPDRGHLQRRRASPTSSWTPTRWPASSRVRSRPGTTRRSPRINDGRQPAEHQNITAVHRADDSGTTENFTDYLHEAAPEVWTAEPDGEWPFKGGEAAPQTSGVVDAVTNGTGTIGYADASKAGDLGVAQIKVGDKFVKYSPEAAAAIVDASPKARGGGPQRQRPGHRARPQGRGRRLPDRAAVLRHRLPEVQGRRDGGQGQGLPRLHRLGGRPAGRGEGRQDGAALGGAVRRASRPRSRRSPDLRSSRLGARSSPGRAPTTLYDPEVPSLGAA